MSDEENKEQRLAFWLPGAAVALTTAAVLFFSVWGWQTGLIDESSNTIGAADLHTAISGTTALPADGSVEASSPAEVILADANPPATANDSARVVAENGMVKFYFAPGKADLAANTDHALQNILQGVAEGKKAVISGFHDETGGQAQNAELSKQRAFAVRDVLLGLNVPEAQIELREPQNTEGSGGNNEARRVEVTLE